MDKPQSSNEGRLWQFHYGPILFHSELELRELHGFSGSGKIPVSLKVGPVPEGLANGVAQGPQRQFAAGEFLLNVPGTGRFLARGGAEVLVQAEPDVAISDLTIYLLGSVFGALCHQNGLLPLHASAVETGGVVTAFLGNSGAGKSSTVALLGGRGYRIFADDICLLEPVGEGLRAAPLAGWLKLWRETFEQIDVEPELENRTFSTDDKYRMYLGPQDVTPLAVRQFVFLTRAPEGQAEARLERLGAAEAIAAMVEAIYPGYLPEDPLEERRLVRQCAQAMTGARAFRLVVPWGWDRVGAALDLVERELLQGDGRGVVQA